MSDAEPYEYRCAWCELEKSYVSLDDVAEDGWIVMTREGGDEYEFCGAACLISWL